jgi:hypothetical protein
MANQRVKGNAFSQSREIAHVHLLLAGAANHWRLHELILTPER